MSKSNTCAGYRRHPRLFFGRMTTVASTAYVNARNKVVRSAPASYDEATADKLWQVSRELTGLAPASPRDGA